MKDIEKTIYDAIKNSTYTTFDTLKDSYVHLYKEVEILMVENENIKQSKVELRDMYLSIGKAMNDLKDGAFEKWCNYKAQCEIDEDYITMQAENARLTEQLKNAMVLPCNVGDTFYGIQGEKTGVYAIFEYPCQKIIINKKSIYLATVYNMEFELDKWAFLIKPEAEARLAELEAHNETE